jgi:N6-L-threonylcarbamoyladenine synthase
MLGLPYPAGRRIDELAEEGDPEAYDFPRPMMHSGDLDMSFAGLKTAIHQFLADQPVPEGPQLRDICASFQRAVVEVLVAKTLSAAKQSDLERVVLSGGVAANSGLRRSMAAGCDDTGRQLFVAPATLCTDNAGMFGPIVEHNLQLQESDGFKGHRIRARSSAAIG